MNDRSYSASLPQAAVAQARTSMIPVARIASLALAALLLVALIVFPGVLMRGDALLTQAVMPVMLIGIGASIAHGLGWRPRSSIAAAAAGPLVAWPLMLAAFAFLAFGAGPIV
ncbi:MAG: cyd operon YbgE family protein [Micropepsaceae bacterium]